MTHHPDHEVELFRDGDAYEVYVALPDCERGDVTVRWNDGRLHVTAETDIEAAGSNGDTPARVFDRHMSVPHEIDADGITASFEDGVLDVHLPIRSESSRPGREIEIEG